MSGATGGGRIPRSAVEQTVKDYTEKILSKIEGFKDAKLSGSFNRPDKEDFGDIDIIVTIETGEDKRTVKQKIAALFQSLPDDELPFLQNPKYKGKKFINHGEMVSNLYPISGMPGEYVQIDNIISLSAEEGDFKKTILDYPAELQGLILGLVKVPLLEEDPKTVFSRLGIDDLPELKEGQEYEFHIDTSGLTLRLVTYGGNYKILDSNVVWQSRSFDDVKTLLKNFNLDGTFEDLMQQLQGLKNERSKNRVKGYFAKSIKVGAAEQGTPKGDSKQKALDAVSMLEENRRILTRAKLMTQFLDEDTKPRIAVFPGAFKPPHRDHVGRIQAAANKVGEDGKVLVLISPLDRAKEGEEPISAKQSAAIFELYKEKGIIPLNVTIKVSELNSPIGAAYKEFESDPAQPYIAVFGKDDAARYRNIEDRLPNVTPDSFEEANVGNISASDLRKAIANRDKEAITSYLPTGVTADEYLNTLGIGKLLDETDTDAAAALWEPHAAMLAKMKKEPELLKGLWKSLSKPSRRALVLYFRREKAKNENVIPKSDEKAAPYGSGYEPVVEETAAVNEVQGKKLRVFDFDDTLVHVDATIYITHKDGSRVGLTPAEYAVYGPQPGDTFNFKEFSSVIKKAKPLENNIKDLIKSYNDPTEKTTILTARLLGYPVKKYLRDEFNIEPYVVGLGSSDPQDKARWIESQISKGYTDIEFRDDSPKNVDAVAALQDKHPEVRLVSTLVTEGVHDPVNPGILKKRLGTLSCTKVKAERAKLKDKGTTYAKALQRYLNYHCNPKEDISEELDSFDRIDFYLKYYTNVSPSTFSIEKQDGKIVIEGFDREYAQSPNTTLDIDKIALLENASYSQHIDIKKEIGNLIKHMLDKGMNIQPLPKLVFKNGDSENAKQFLGKTAYYDPNSMSIVLYTEGRHPKDIVRSFSHEMIHHIQNLENRLGDVSTTNTMEDDNIDKLEQEANLKGTMTFRNWTDSLNEAIVGGKIVCDNCGWGWNIKDGGKNPYTCHKCDHDNTPLEEKKNKDPFGLNQYARELAQGLEETIVMEGRYDTITNQISSEIFNNWKAQFDKNNTTKEALFTKSYDLENAAGRPIVFDLAASLNFKETEEGTYNVDGDADAGDEEVYDADGELEEEGLDGSISLYFQVDPRELPRLWSTISMDLKDIVRHEIEHLTQSGYNVIDSKRLPDDRMLRMYIQDLQTLPERNYYLLDKEIPATLQGMYFKAKKMKEPFAKVVNDYLSIQKVSDEDREIILNRWRPAAKTLNLPNL